MSIGELWPQANMWGLYHLGDANDSSGNGRHLTATGSPSYYTSGGKFGRYVNLTGSQYLRRTTDIPNGLNDLSFMMWFKLSSEISSGYYYIFNLQEYNTYVANIYYNYNSGIRQLKMSWSSYSGTYNITLGTSDWYLIGFSKDASGVKAYLNGVEIISCSVGTASYFVDTTMTIGASGSGSSMFNGRMSEFAVFTDTKPASWWRKQYAAGRGLFY